MPPKPFAGTKAEFKYRVWFFAGLFFAAYSCYFFDRQNSAEFLTNWLARQFPHLTDDAWARIVIGLCAALVLFAATIRTWGTSYLRAFVMQDSKLHSDRLVADGPFRYVRNPLYFGNVLMAYGMGITMSRTGFFVVVVGMYIFSYRLILREESELSESQGENYRAYCAAVPRLLPSLTPRVPAAGNSPHWLDGFIGELMFWGMGASLVVLTVTLRTLPFECVLWVSFLLPWLTAILRGKPAASAA